MIPDGEGNLQYLRLCCSVLQCVNHKYLTKSYQHEHSPILYSQTYTNTRIFTYTYILTRIADAAYMQNTYMYKHIAECRHMRLEEAIDTSDF